MSVVPTSDTKVEIRVDATPTGSPPIPEPEYHLTFVDSTLAPVSLFRQILERLREPKITVPKKHYQGRVNVDATPTGGPPSPEPEYHPTFVDSTLAPVSLFRQILERLREPKITVPKKYYRGSVNVDATPTGGPPLPGPEYHPTFVDSTLAPVSLFRQILERLREPKITVPKEYYRGKVTLPSTDTPPLVPDPNQFMLPFEKPEAPSIPITSKPIDVPEGWQNYHLLLELDPEAIKWRRRTMYLLSVILHGILVLILVFSPDLLRRGKQMMGFPVEVAPKKQFSFLLLPPDVLRRLTEPPPEDSPLSDRNRRAQGRSPIINPNGLRMPYSLGNTKLPELAGGGKPPAAAPTPPPGGGNTAPASPPSNQPSNRTPEESQKDGRLQLEDVKPNTGGGSGLNLPNLSPGQAIQQSLQSAARGGRYAGGSGSGAGYGDGSGEFRNLEPNFSTEGPIILSDTRGVDFGPYLARVVFVVKRNWYSMIPESARLGEKGRVGIVFEILKDGTVPQLRLVASSGADPLDRAALAGIHASIPFPPLPEEFTGNHLVLQFIFLYNMTMGQ
ncbi:MAG: energy transducer TonB [Terriglobia bacterium]|jgi:TonB family protein